MPEPIVMPPWDSDPLSTYMGDSGHNARAASLNWPDVYAVQQRANDLLRRVGEIIGPEVEDSKTLGAPRMLIHRSHASILATMRLAMSGQATEAQAVLRVAIEAGWYALHIAKDPVPPTRAQIWWDRDDSAKTTEVCAKEFSIGNVRRTHEALDATTAAVMHRLYKDRSPTGATRTRVASPWAFMSSHRMTPRRQRSASGSFIRTRRRCSRP